MRKDCVPVGIVFASVLTAFSFPAFGHESASPTPVNIVAHAGVQTHGAGLHQNLSIKGGAFPTIGQNILAVIHATNPTVFAAAEAASVRIAAEDRSLQISHAAVLKDSELAAISHALQAGTESLAVGRIGGASSGAVALSAFPKLLLEVSNNSKTVAIFGHTKQGEEDLSEFPRSDVESKNGLFPQFEREARLLERGEQFTSQHGPMVDDKTMFLSGVDYKGLTIRALDYARDVDYKGLTVRALDFTKDVDYKSLTVRASDYARDVDYKGLTVRALDYARDVDYKGLTVNATEYKRDVDYKGLSITQLAPQSNKAIQDEETDDAKVRMFTTTLQSKALAVGEAVKEEKLLSTEIARTVDRKNLLFGQAIRQTYQESNVFAKFVRAGRGGPVTPSSLAIAFVTKPGNEVAVNRSIRDLQASELLVADRQLSVKIGEIDIFLSRGTIAYISKTDAGVGIYNLGGTTRGVTVKAEGTIHPLFAGSAFLVPSSKETFAELRAADRIATRDLENKVLPSGKLVYLTAFSQLSAIKEVTAIKSLLASDLRADRRIVESILKSVIVAAHLSPRSDPFL